jgi:heptosyltransferase-3
MSGCEPERLLFVSLSNIGDAVLTTPALEALHQRFPNHVIDLVCDQRSAQIFEYCPYRGEVFIKDKRSGWRSLIGLIKDLRQRRYLVMVDLRTDGLTYLLRGKRRLTRRGIDRIGLHAVEQHYGVVAPLLNGGEIPDTRVWLSDEERRAAAGWLGDLPSGRWLGLGPGANFPGKIWPAAHFRDLVEMLRDRFAGVAILGGVDDSAVGPALAEQLDVPSIMLCGRTTLLQAAAVLECMTAFVGNDSGLGHIASAVGTPTLTLFGIGHPERYRPWGQRAAYLVGAGEDVGRVSPDQVAVALSSLLSRLGSF